jgi:hypothetical protein
MENSDVQDSVSGAITAGAKQNPLVVLLILALMVLFGAAQYWEAQRAVGFSDYLKDRDRTFGEFVANQNKSAIEYQAAQNETMSRILDVQNTVVEKVIQACSNK